MRGTCRIMIGLMCLWGAVGLLSSPVFAEPQGTMTVGFDNMPKCLDKWMDSSGASSNVAINIFDSLLAKDPKTAKPIPWLATSWNLLNDTTWEFTLRQGVQFTNGEPFNAQSVKYSIERAINPESQSINRTIWDWIKEVKIIEDYTVHIITHKPYPIALELLAGAAYALPPKYTEEAGQAKFCDEPIATGRYMVKEWKKGERIVLEANPHYWGPKPDAQTLIIRYIPELSTLVASLLAGEVDYITGVEPDQVPLLEADPNVKVLFVPRTWQGFVQMDGDQRAPGTHKAMTDVRVRRAICHAINTQEIIENLMPGQAAPIQGGVLHHLYFGFDPSIKGFEYDPALSKKLLAEAGYPNGFEIKLYSYGTKQATEAIQEYLSKIGIKADIQWYLGNDAQLTRLRGAGKVDDMALWGWWVTVNDADAILYPWFHSSGNRSYNRRPELDAWLDEARSTMDQNRRKELYSLIQRYIIDNAFWCPMFERNSIEAIRSDRISYEPYRDGAMRLFELKWANK